MVELVGGSEAADREGTSDDEGAAIRVKVRGKRSAGKQCFLLLEEVLGIIDQVSVKIEMRPDGGPGALFPCFSILGAHRYVPRRVGGEAHSQLPRSWATFRSCPRLRPEGHHQRTRQRRL